MRASTMERRLRCHASSSTRFLSRERGRRRRARPPASNQSRDALPRDGGACVAAPRNERRIEGLSLRRSSRGSRVLPTDGTRAKVHDVPRDASDVSRTKDRERDPTRRFLPILFLLLLPFREPDSDFVTSKLRSYALARDSFHAFQEADVPAELRREGNASARYKNQRILFPLLSSFASERFQEVATKRNVVHLAKRRARVIASKTLGTCVGLAGVGSLFETRVSFPRAGRFVEGIEQLFLRVRRMVSTRRKRYSQGTKIDVEDGSRAEEAPVVASERKARGTRSLGNEKDAKKEEDDGGEAPEEVGFEEVSLPSNETFFVSMRIFACDGNLGSDRATSNEWLDARCKGS